MEIPLAIHVAPRKRVALIAHDNCKIDMLDWARYNRETLAGHELSPPARRGHGARGSPSSRGGGSGIVKQSGGSILVESEIGRGTTVCLR